MASRSLNKTFSFSRPSCLHKWSQSGVSLYLAVDARRGGGGGGEGEGEEAYSYEGPTRGEVSMYLRCFLLNRVIDLLHSAEVL